MKHFIAEGASITQRSPAGALLGAITGLETNKRRKRELAPET